MFIRRELRKGNVELRLRAPEEMIEVLDLSAQARGISRQDLVLYVLDQYCNEILSVSSVLAHASESQRKRSGNAAEMTEEDKQ